MLIIDTFTIAGIVTTLVLAGAVILANAQGYK